MRVLEEKFIGYDDSGNSLNYIKAAGEDSDASSLPEAGICTGSEFLAVDTGDKYYFDEAGTAGSKWAVPTPAS